MGWGEEPHEGYTARRLTVQAGAHNDYPDQGDVRWTAGWSLATSGTEGWQARCTCGWRSGLFHEKHLDVAEALVGEPDVWQLYDEWRDTHMAPLVDPEPDSVLVLAADEGGPRHFLAGQAVHAGATLELRLADDLWVPVRYEWSWDRRTPRAYLALGGRCECVAPRWTPGPVSFDIPGRAELRWPVDDRRPRPSGGPPSARTGR